MCSDAPDPDPLIGQSALNNSEISRDALQFYKDQAAAQAPRQAKLDALTEQLANQQISTSAFNDTQAREQWKRYQEQGIPAEDRMYADAVDYDSQVSRDKAAGQAATDVGTSLAMANDARRRTLARQGVNPADGRSLSMENDAATQGALATASAMNKARDDRELQGIMLRKDAASFGRGATGTAAQTFGVASAAGGQAAGAVGSAISAANQTTGTTGAGFNTAISGNSSAGSLMTGLYGAQNQANQSGVGGALAGLGQLGSGLGAMGVAFSDENMKENMEPVDGRAALQGVRALDVKKWNYKGDSPAADGGQPHVGAMAQDMQQNLGDEVAPGGKLMDTVSAIGATMAAVQELDKKVERLAAKGIKR